LSPPVCAMTRPAPRNNVITNVEIFFIRFSDQIFIKILLRVPPGNLHRLAGTFCRLLTRAAGDSCLRRWPDAASSLKTGFIGHLKSGLMAAGFTFLFQQKRRPCPGRLSDSFRSYFGGGVVVPPEFFLLFLPPL
jgi:hypothetical protein